MGGTLNFRLHGMAVSDNGSPQQGTGNSATFISFEFTVKNNEILHRCAILCSEDACSTILFVNVHSANDFAVTVIVASEPIDGRVVVGLSLIKSKISNLLEILALQLVGIGTVESICKIFQLASR